MDKDNRLGMKGNRQAQSFASEIHAFQRLDNGVDDRRAAMDELSRSTPARCARDFS
jgi:hypothetical protein